MSLRRAAIAGCVVAALMCGTSRAQTDSQVSEQPEFPDTGNAGLWMLGLLLQSDDESSRGSAVSFGYGIGESTWFSAMATRSSSPAERADITADAFVIGLDHQFEKVGVSFDFEDWGDSGAVESQDLGVSFYVQAERFRFELGLEQRDMDISFSLALGDRVFTRKVPIDADGWLLGFDFDVSENVRVFYDYRDYDYSRNLAVLPRIAQFSRLIDSPLTLANSFLSDAHTLGVDVLFGDKALSLTLAEDTSAVDGRSLSSFGAALMLPVAERVDLEFSLGRSDSQFFDSSVYAGVGVLIYGG